MCLTFFTSKSIVTVMASICSTKSKMCNCIRFVTTCRAARVYMIVVAYNLPWPGPLGLLSFLLIVAYENTPLEISTQYSMMWGIGLDNIPSDCDSTCHMPSPQNCVDGITAELLDVDLWWKFYTLGTEMIVTPHGRSVRGRGDKEGGRKGRGGGGGGGRVGYGRHKERQ